MRRELLRLPAAAAQVLAKATYHAVASGLVRIVEAILRDQSTVLSVSSLLHGEYGINDVCLRLPTVVHRAGVERVIGLPLAPEEEAALRKSAEVLHRSIESLRDMLPQ